MTPSNLWALIIALFVVGGAVVGGLIWRQNHPDAPAQLSRLVEPLVPKITEKLAPPPAAPPQPDATKPEASEGAAGSQPPQFDVVRVEPSGDAVFAGKGDPNAMVALVEGGRVVAETKADPSGNFVILPPALKPGDHDLSLQQSVDGKPGAGSKQNVAISIPKQPGGQVVVALAEPGKPTKLLSAPPKAAAPAIANAPPPDAQKPAGSRDVAVAKPETAIAPPAAIAPKGPDLAFRTVEMESGNGFFATGVATPGTKIELYLNGAHIAEVTAANDGQWSVTIKKGLTGGHYGVRADAIGADRKVVARAEVPFDVPVAMGAPMKAPPGPAKVAPSEAQQAAEAKAAEAKAAAARQAAEAKQVEEAQKAAAAQQTADALKAAETQATEARKAAETQKAEAAKAAAAQKVAETLKAAERRASEARAAAEAQKVAERQMRAAEQKAAAAEKAAAARAPPNPSTLAELKNQSLAGPPKGDIQPVVPAPRPDIAAAAKATTQAAPGKTPPTLAMAPPARNTGPDAVPAPTPPAGATAPQTTPARMAVAPAKSAAAPPVIASTKPAIAPPKRAEVAVAVGAKPADEAVPFAAQEQGQVPGQSGNAANAVIQEVETALVIPGDNLWNISRAKLGNATRYTQIYAANVSQIRNPNLIYPGQVFVMPQ